MFKKINTTILIFLTAFSAIKLKAQQADSTNVLPAYITLFGYNALWHNGNNAAGLRQDSILAFGKTKLGFDQMQGQFKLAQQAKDSQRLNFESERFQNIGKTLFYGKFSYTQQWDKQLRFSDVLDPYRGTPYLLADSIGGDWKKQLYTLTLKAASPALLNNKLTIGLGTTLNVATGARQNDPRPLSTSNQITIAPSATWKLNKSNLIGLNGWYNRYREDISLEVKNSSINYSLYKSLGLGQLELPTTFTTGASRIYKGNKWGGDIQYQLKNNSITWLNNFGYRTYQEQVADGTSVPRKSGTWKQTAYSFNSNLNIGNKNFLHRFALTLQRLEDQGIEFHEFYNTSLKAWQTLLEAEFYLAETDQASLSYTLIKPNKEHVFNWLAEIGGSYYSTNKSYLLPASSQVISNAGIWLKGTKVWSFNRNTNLQTGVTAFYNHNLDQLLSYIPITGDRTLLAREVLYPDHDYLSSNFIATTVNLQIDFKVEKVKNVRFLIAGSVSNQHSLTTNIYPNATGNRNYWSFSLGALY